MIKTTSTFKHSSLNSTAYSLKAMSQKPVFQVSTALMLTLFAILFFGVFAIRPTLSTIAELIRKIDEQKIIVEKLNKKSSALATAQSEYLLVENKLPLVSAAIPPEHKTDLLLQQIESVAAGLQLPLSSIQVDSIDIPTDPEASRIVDGIVELPLSITLESPYPSLRSMLELLTRLKRFMTVETITFVVDDAQSSPTQSIRMTLQVFAYYLPTIQETPTTQ